MILALLLLACNGGDRTGDTDTDLADTDTADTDASAADCGGNVLVGSCLDDWLLTCWAPDLTGECTDSGTALTWSDGHNIQRIGMGSGFYAPGDEEACLAFTYNSGSRTVTYFLYSREITDVNVDGTHTVTCSDGTSFQYSDAEGAAYNECRGITCPG